jgi:hypothetical protein
MFHLHLSPILVEEDSSFHSKRKFLRLIAGASGMVMLGKSRNSFSATVSQVPTKISAAIVGQSNESFSWWNTVSANLLAERGINLKVTNTAVGSTSLAESWVGSLRPWTRLAILTRGSQVISGDYLFRCTAAVGTAVQTKVAPQGSDSMVSGVSTFTGTDAVPWLYMGKASDAQKNRVAKGNFVLSWQNDPVLFDPNGYLKRALTALGDSTGEYSQWIYISIGQTDKTLGIVESDYAAALRATVDYFLNPPNASPKWRINVMIGFTCSAQSAAVNDWFDNQLIPAWVATNRFYGTGGYGALGSVVRRHVFAGANLHQELPVLLGRPLTVSLDPTVPGLNADGLHMNAAAQTLAARLWTNKIESVIDFINADPK